MNSRLKYFYLIPKPKGLIEKAMKQSNSASNSGYLLLGVCLAKIGMVFAWLLAPNWSRYGPLLISLGASR
jgi:hypothetical protein